MTARVTVLLTLRPPLPVATMVATARRLRHLRTQSLTLRRTLLLRQWPPTRLTLCVLPMHMLLPSVVSATAGRGYEELLASPSSARADWMQHQI